MIDEEFVTKQIAQLTPAENVRVCHIMHALPRIIDALVSCAGPDDAKIALCAAIGTVFGLQCMPGSQWTTGKMANVITEFVVEEMLARRKRAKSVRQNAAD
jgi:uncharacterized membrane protein SirB2